MSKGITVGLTGTFVLFLFLSADSVPQDTIQGSVRIMFYNVENLFDIYDDPVTDDNEFTPQGIRRWTQGRYLRKLSSVQKAIIASGEWEPPAVTGLCEVENRKVLEDLVNNTILSKYNYGIIHEDSPDPRGIDVCLIYRKDVVSVDTFEYFSLPSGREEEFLTRSILYARCLLKEDTIHLFFNHWPSRRGGVLAAESQRVRIAELLKSRIDSVASVSGTSGNFLLMGDFNATPADDVIKIISGTYKSGIAMTNLSGLLKGEGGTYRYRGNWENIDQAIVSSGLLGDGPGLKIKEGKVVVAENGFLMTDDPVYPGRSPFPTWKGYNYEAGFSDHLPVWVDLTHPGFRQRE